MKNIKLVIAILVSTSYCCCLASASRILMALPSHSRSHVIIARALLEGLADRGHEVTLISSFPQSKQIANYRDIFLEWPESLKDLYGNATVKNKSRFKVQDVFSLLPNIMDYVNGTLAIPEMRTAMTTETFDLVIVPAFGGRFLSGLAAHFECPLVYFLPVRPLFAVSSLIGNPSQRSAVPQLITGYTTPMSFWERIKNLLFYAAEELFFALLNLLESHYYAAFFTSPRYPSYSEVTRNASLFLVGHHFSQGPIAANLPSIIEIGGIQMEAKLRPLPEDLRDFLYAADDGFIYFSLGTNVKLTAIDQGKLNAIVGALGRLQLPVIFKVDEDMSIDNLPANVLARPWLPQREILAHKNVKLFISHGGLGSLVEAKYYGVPVLGIPMFGDQLGNVQRAVQDGWALSADFNAITEDGILNKIDSLLGDGRYRETVKRFSEIYRDRPMTPLDTAAYWLEYVIRHRGAPHLQSPAANMNFIQRHSIDVFAFIFIVVFMIILGLKEFAIFVISSCRAFKLLIKIWWMRRRGETKGNNKRKAD